VDWRRPRRQSVCNAAGDARCDPNGARHLLTYYQGQLQQIIDLLTTSAQQQPVSGELQKRLYSYVVQVNAPDGEVFGQQYEFEYYAGSLSASRRA